MLGNDPSNGCAGCALLRGQLVKGVDDEDSDATQACSEGDEAEDDVAPECESTTADSRQAPCATNRDGTRGHIPLSSIKSGVC